MPDSTPFFTADDIRQMTAELVAVGVDVAGMSDRAIATAYIAQLGARDVQPVFRKTTLTDYESCP